MQVLDIREKELGPDHVDVAASLNNIAVLLKTSGQFEEAEEMYTRSIAIKEKALGPKHPQVSHKPILHFPSPVHCNQLVLFVEREICSVFACCRQGHTVCTYSGLDSCQIVCACLPPARVIRTGCGAIAGPSVLHHWSEETM